MADHNKIPILQGIMILDFEAVGFFPPGFPLKCHPFYFRKLSTMIMQSLLLITFSAQENGNGKGLCHNQPNTDHHIDPSFLFSKKKRGGGWGVSLCFK